MIRVLAATLAILLLALSGLGCWDREELEDLAFVSVIGIDRGRENSLRVSFLIPIPRSRAEVGGGDGKGDLLTTVESESLLEAKNLANVHVSRRIILSQVSVYVIGEDLARSGIEDYLKPFSRDRELRLSLPWIVVVKGTAAGFLGALKPSFETHGARHLVESLDSWRHTGLAPKLQLLHYYQESAFKGGSGVIPLGALNEVGLGQPGVPVGSQKVIPGRLPRRGGSPLDIVGAAIFRENRMVGEIDGREVRIRNFLAGTFQSGIFKFDSPSDPDKSITLSVRHGSPPEVIVQPGHPTRVDIKVLIEADLSGQLDDNDYSSLANTRRLEDYLNRRLKEDTDQLVKRAQKEFKTDIFNLDRHARRRFLTTPEWDKFNWTRQFLKAEINVKYDLELRRFGMQLGPVKMKE